MHIRPITDKEHSAYDELARSYGCVFDSLRWTEIFGSTLTRLGIFDAGDHLRGGFCVWEQRRFGLRIWRNPPNTPHIGPFFESRSSNPAARTDEQRVVVTAVAEYLSTSGAAVTSLGLALGITDTLPFYWLGWKIVPHYTYRIDLSQREDTLLAAMSTVRRKNIRKANADGLTVTEVADTAEMRDLIKATFARQDMMISMANADLVFSAFPPGNSSYCMTVQQGDGRPIAGVYVVHDAHTAYYLMGGYSDNGHHGAGALAMWHAILKAKMMGLKIFDFEGSMIPPIERYFRGFGGTLTPMFGVHKAWLPIELALKVWKRNIF